jgi:hypothetical protein
MQQDRQGLYIAVHATGHAGVQYAVLQQKEQDPHMAVHAAGHAGVHWFGAGKSLFFSDWAACICRV